MHPQKSGRLPYVILTIVPPCVLLYIPLQLSKVSNVPIPEIVMQVSFGFSLFVLCFLSHFLIYKKNHIITIKDNTITETDWRHKHHHVIKTTQICNYRRNILGEIVLLDNTQTKILCIEANMSNFDAFQQWLVRHNIIENKEK